MTEVKSKHLKSSLLDESYLSYCVTTFTESRSDCAPSLWLLSCAFPWLVCCGVFVVLSISVKGVRLGYCHTR